MKYETLVPINARSNYYRIDPGNCNYLTLNTICDAERGGGMTFQEELDSNYVVADVEQHVISLYPIRAYIRQ